MNSSNALCMYKHNLQMGTVACSTGGGEGAHIRTGKSRVSVSSEHLPFCYTPALEAQEQSYHCAIPFKNCKHRLLVRHTVFYAKTAFKAKQGKKPKTLRFSGEKAWNQTLKQTS